MVALGAIGEILSTYLISAPDIVQAIVIVGDVCLVPRGYSLDVEASDVAGRAARIVCNPRRISRFLICIIELVKYVIGSERARHVSGVSRALHAVKPRRGEKHLAVRDQTYGSVEVEVVFHDSGCALVPLGRLGASEMRYGVAVDQLLSVQVGPQTDVVGLCPRDGGYFVRRRVGRQLANEATGEHAGNVIRC